MHLVQTILCVSLLCAGHLMAQTLPYNPTRVFQSPNDSSVVYIFEPSSSASPYGQLVALNVSSTIHTSNITATILTSSLPFLVGDSAGNTTTFSPAISRTGSILVYAGSCNSTASLWIYQPYNGSVSGSWSQITNAISSTTADISSASFLSKSFIFSALVDANYAQRTMYIFGGMCPTGTSASSSTWQEAATYTNRMLKLSTPSTTSLQISLSSNTGSRPIAEAGFTITGLTETISNSSSGVVTQARNFVLLGGHTQTAFINMSQVAIFSLPQESWSFQTVANGNQGSTELAMRSAISKAPDSRSGHTSILTADGSAIIVFGGWVGDVNTPADPQLAMLRLGSGFGGNGDWAWDIPTTSGTGLQTGTGIYGHDAIMLPGNVMMVVGGINMPAPKDSKRSPKALQTYFLNTTSLTWISQYTNPSPSGSTLTSPSSGSSSSDTSGNATKVGLGAGLGLGLAAVIGAIVVYFWYSKKLTRSPNSSRQRSLHSTGSDLSIEGASWWTGTGGGEMVQREGLISQHDGSRALGLTYGNDEEFSGLYSVPAPGSRSSLQRKPLNSRSARGYYQSTPASNFDFGPNHGRNNSLGTAGAIHPIYEADEDMDIGEAQTTADASTAQPSDPFIDPPRRSPLRSHPMRLSNLSDDAPQSPAQEREREVQEWVADWEAADAILNNASRTQSFSQNTGRISPSKESGSGRTESNLSERSITTVSAIGVSRQSSVNTRSNSLTAFFASNGASWNPFFNPNSNNTHSGPGDVSPISERSAKSTAPPRSSGSGSGSFATANTSQSMPAIRTEGETLLAQPNDSQPGSPSKSKPPRLQKRINWLGSLKRALGRGPAEEWVSSSGSASSTSSPTRDRYPEQVQARDPEKRAEPRRTVSASATLWRRKQGRGDWEDSAEPTVGQRSNTLTGHEMMVGDDDEEEWDVEKAIRRRVVQVMFTVPKERLRVVNVDDDRMDDERSDSGDGLAQMSEKQLEHAEQTLHFPAPPSKLETARWKGKENEMDTAEMSAEKNSPSSSYPTEKKESLVRRDPTEMSAEKNSPSSSYAIEKEESLVRRDPTEMSAEKNSPSSSHTTEKKESRVIRDTEEKKVSPVSKDTTETKESLATYDKQQEKQSRGRKYSEKEENQFYSDTEEEEEPPIRREDTRSPERIARDLVLEKSRTKARSTSPEKGAASPMGRVAEMVERMERGS